MDKRKGFIPLISKRLPAAFTLVELLVVIAIIALLMSILMPTLNRAKKQARSAACQMNLKQWGLIWMLYTEDNEGFFPEAGSLGWARGTWIIALRPQWDTRTDILLCPMATKRSLTGAQGGPFNTYVMGGGGVGNLREEASYGANNWIYNTKTDIQGRKAEWHWKTVHVQGTSNIPVFADTMWRGGGPSEQGAGGDPPKYNGEWNGYNKEMKHFCIDRHNGNVNHLFMDWTVRKVGLKELWTLKWHRNFDNLRGYWTKSGGATYSTWANWGDGWLAKYKEY